MRKFSSSLVTSAVVGGSQFRACAGVSGEEEGATTSTTTVLSHCAGLYRSKLITGEVLPYPCPALAEEQVSNVNEVLEAVQPRELTAAKLAEKAAKRKADATGENADDAAMDSNSKVGVHLLSKEVAEAGLSGALVAGVAGASPSSV
jgi:Na+-translocating ferredoxin:NAD+ oxidoreductase RnfG subunit